MKEFQRVDFFQNNETYQRNSKQVKQMLSSNNIEGIMSLVAQMQKIITASHIDPMQKLLCLRFVKESLEVCPSYTYLKLLESQIAPHLYSICQYRRDVQSDDRGKTLFTESEDKKLEQLGNSILRMSLETLETMAELFPEGICQHQKYPSLFYCFYEQLRKLGVKFPTQYSYYKEPTKQKIRNAYGRITNIDSQIESFLLPMIDLVQQGLKSQDIDYTYIVGRVASTGDSNFIEQLISVLHEQFTRDPLNIPIGLGIVSLLNTLFVQAELELLIQIRNKFTIPLMNYAFCIGFKEQPQLAQPYPEIQVKKFRKSCLQTLCLWSCLTTSQPLINMDSIHTLISHLDIQPDQYVSLQQRYRLIKQMI